MQYKDYSKIDMDNELEVKEMIADALTVSQQITDIVHYHPESKPDSSRVVYKCNELEIASTPNRLYISNGNNLLYQWYKDFYNDVDNEWKTYERPHIFRNGNWRVLLDAIHATAMVYKPDSAKDKQDEFAPFDLYDVSIDDDGVARWADEHGPVDFARIQPTHEQTIKVVYLQDANRLARRGWTLRFIIQPNGEFDPEFVMVKDVQNAGT